MRIRSLYPAAAVLSFCCFPLFSQPGITITAPAPPPIVGPLLRPFHLEKRVVSPARFADSPRLEMLVRGGNLYLTAQDVIALVLENNLDIDIQRYGPFLSREVQRRTEGGGYLRNVDTAVLAGPQSVSLAGVSVNANGLGGGTGVGSAAVSCHRSGRFHRLLIPSSTAVSASVTQPRPSPTRC